MANTRYEIPWRPVYEFYAAIAWMLGGLCMYAILLRTQLPKMPFFISLGASIAMASWRLVGASLRIRRKKFLNAAGVEFITGAWLKAKGRGHGDDCWLGRGFNWDRESLERAMEVLKNGPKNYLRAGDENGGYWIHGVGGREEDIRLPLKYLERQTVIVGTNGTGKTRLFDLLISQAVERGEPVIIFDPKGDHDLREKARLACVRAGQPERFCYFHPAFPEESIRIDPLHNWQRATEVASRVASLIPSETGMDPWKSFGWMALSNIIGGLLLIDDKPNLISLRRNLEGDPSALVERALRVYFERGVPNWEARAKKHQPEGKTDDKRLKGLITFYLKELVNEGLANPAIDGLLATFEHNRDHYKKMTASLMPILTMLTTGSLGKLLSPTAGDGDPRQITDSKRIIENGQVAYIGLDSLSDATISGAIGSILLADLASVAGDRYNNTQENPTRVNVFVDEAAEVLNQPTIQLMNKGRGAGFCMTLAMQTLADLEVRTGSAEAARQVVGNANNLICLRVLDGETQKYIAENMPCIGIRSLEQNYRSGTMTDQPDEMSGSYGETLKETESELFPGPLLGMLPDLHYFAKFANGKTVKGRLPILRDA